MDKAPVYPEDNKAFVYHWYDDGQGNRTNLFWDSLLHGVIKGLWKERNKRLFEEKISSKGDVIDYIFIDVCS